MLSARRRVAPEWRLVLVALAAGALLTAAVTVVMVRADKDLDGEALERRADVVAAQIERVVDEHTAVLYGIRSMYVASGELSRAAFQRFVVDGGLLQRYPGAQAFEIARQVERSELAAYEQTVRSDRSIEPGGYPDFAVHPESGGDVRWVVDFIEPMEPNRVAFGLDLGAEAERRAALLEARDHDEPRTTGPIRLVQETGDQTGLLVLLPIYEGDTPPRDVVGRRRATVGFALVVYRAGDMLAAVEDANDDIEFSIDDVGAGPDAAADPRTLYATGPIDGATDEVRFPVHGRTWSLTVGGLAGSGLPWAFPLFGALTTIVVAGAIYHLAAAQRRATARARVLAASDAQRRRLERDLHDGAQQRLLSVSLLLARAERATEPAGDLVRTARERVAESLQELRELAHGIHPAAVTDHGLAIALEQLAARATLPVDLDLDAFDEPAPHVAVTAYYVVAEALTNVTRHAHASRAVVSIRRDDDRLVLTVADDGVGGASTGRGTGLEGLADRVDAVGGKLTVHSPAGEGTTIRAVLPCVS